MHRRRFFLLSCAWWAGAVASAQDAPPPVEVERSVLAPVATRLELTGSVTANRRSQLSPRTAGLVAAVHVDAGRQVARGEVLLELDPELAEIELGQIRVELEQAEIALVDAKRLVEEVRGLASRGAFAESELASRVTTARMAASAVDLLQEREKRQQAVLERHRLVAPYDGVISRKLADEGEWVETGTPVLELVELARPRLDVQAPQEFFAALEPGQPAKVELDAHPGREFDAVVSALVPVKDGAARTFLVRLEMETEDAVAAPGMSGRAIFSLSGKREVVQVPRDAVVRFPDGSAKVWTVVEQGGSSVVRSREVVTGVSLSGLVEVLDGLDAGVVVVVRGNEGLEEDQTVQLLPDSGAGEP